MSSATTGGSPLSFSDIAAIGGLPEVDFDSMANVEGDTGTDRSEVVEIDLGRLAKSPDTVPVVRLVNVLLVDSLRRGATDVHVEPYEKEYRVRFRIDGVLQNVMALPPTLRDPLTQRIRSLARLNPTQRRLRQDGLIRVRLRIQDRSRDVAFTVCVRPTLWGETIIMRPLDRSRFLLDSGRLGFEPVSLERFRRALSLTHGLVVFTGPRGSGRTNTLLAAAAPFVMRPGVHVLAVEETVEFSMPGANQVQVVGSVGESRATVLQSVRRLDADVILVDSIRDPEVAGLATALADEGHLVLSTLPGSDAPSALKRLALLGSDPRCRAMGVDHEFVGMAVKLVVAQRLVRRICIQCRTDGSTEVPPETLIDLGFEAGEIGTFPVMRGGGCPDCNGTGFKGRAGLFEVLETSEPIRDLVTAGATAREIRRKAIEEGMLTLRMSGLEKIRNGVTTVEEVRRETA